MICGFQVSPTPRDYLTKTTMRSEHHRCGDRLPLTGSERPLHTIEKDERNGQPIGSPCHATCKTTRPLRFV